MVAVRGYQVGDGIGGGPFYSLFGAVRVRDGRDVILKTVSPGGAQVAAAARLRREFQFSGSLDLPGIARVLDLADQDDQPLLVIEHVTGVTLDTILVKGSLTLDASLRVATQLAGALSALHHHSLVHRDVQPCNILVDPQTWEARLTGLGAATSIPRQVQATPEPRAPGGGLAYMSPEQTGRTNRLVDYRTDFYSLGVTLFEMLTGRLPFEGTDPLELIHAHVAKQPPSPAVVAPGLPHPVAKIVLKLMAKAAEDRYQSGLGLRADLEACLGDLESAAEIRPLELGRQDVPARFELPQTLYGREQELDRLLHAVERAAGGGMQVALVRGYPGVGKTALVQSLRKQVLMRRAFFTSGSYDELKRGTPYSGILEALRYLVRRLLAEVPERVEAYRRELTEALGANLGVVVDVVTELEGLVGKVPPVAVLGPTEAKVRFHLSIQRLLAVFAAGAPPLVVFLDNLQWIDSASVELLEGTVDRNLGNLLLVGAYRDDEVGEGHPVLDFADAVQSKGVPVETLGLRPLSPVDVSRLVADALWTDPERCAGLAEAVFRKSAGNPLLAKACLTALHDEGLVRFDPAAGWSWELPRIAELAATRDAGDLTRRRIAHLPEKAHRTIAMAAALGQHFAAETLAAVCETPVSETKADLVAGCRERVLLKDEDGYRFEHEALREAAYALIPESGRPEAHLRIGQLLKVREPQAAASSRIFDIVGHLNRGASLIEEPAEREELARLNLAAGRKARSSAAYRAAFQYFCEGTGLLGPSAWEDRYELCLALHSEAADAALSCADFPEADRLVRVVHDKAKTVLDEIPAYETQISAAHVRLREADALAISVEVLKLLGIRLPEGPTQADVDEAVRKARAALEGVLSSELVGEPAPMTDPSQLASMRILLRAIHTAAWTNYPLLHVMTCKALELTVRYGHSPESPVAYLLTGVLLCHVLHDYDGGYRAGIRGLALSELPTSARWRPFCLHVFHGVISGWRVPHRSLIPHVGETHRMAMESGDVLSAVIGAYVHCETALYAGVELPQLREVIRGYREELTAVGVGNAAVSLRWLDRLVVGLMDGFKEASGTAEDMLLDQEAWEAWRGGADRVVRQVIYCHEMMVRHLLRDRAGALQTALQVESHQVGRLSVTIPIYFYLCLCLLDQGRLLPERERQRLLEKVAVHHEALRLRARACPMNYSHRLNLVDAQRHRLLRETDLAIACFEKAIAEARDNGYVHEEALANELAGEFFLELGSRQVAAMYLNAAVATYARWGAYRKVAQLHETHPAFLSGQGTEPATARFETPAEASDPTASAAALDMESLERAAHTLAGELDLARLVRKLMHLLLQNAGAQRGLLLRTENGGVYVEATGSVDREDIEFPLSAPLESREDLCRGVVRYVSRSLEPVVLGDALLDDRFAGDPYVEREKPASILCSPVLHQGRPVAILYLENNRIRNAFNEARLTAVRLISSQAAVALDNARLHDHLKKEIEVRQRAEDELREALDQVAKLKDRLEAENVYLREEIQGSHDFEEIVGESPALKSALRKVDLVAATDAAVLILGETGTGKELIARAIHGRSPRRDSPLVKLNCAALPSTLIESELFGHEKGAFTGALGKRVGRFELADGGTIFLDEIGDLPLELQSKLLRVLQEGEFERLGSGTTRKVDVRVIAATNRDLERAVADGDFRSDLYYRLSVFPVRVPPLRDRIGDVPLLVWSFITKKQKAMGKAIEKVPKDVMDALLAYQWPGNVRELENVVERALILSPGPVLTLDEVFAPSHAVAPPPQAPAPAQTGENIEDVERAHIVRVLEGCNWRIKGKGNAAERLGLPPSTLQSRMKKLGIQRPKT